MKSKRINVDIDKDKWYKICTLTSTTIAYYATNCYTLSIPITYSANVIIALSCGMRPDNGGFAISRIITAMISSNANFVGTFKIGYKIYNDGASCSVYVQAKTNISRLSSVSLLGIASERLIPNLVLDALSATEVTDESYFDSVQTIFDNNSGLVKLPGTTDIFDFCSTPQSTRVLGTYGIICGGQAKEIILAPKGTANVGVTVLLMGRYGIVSYIMGSGSNNTTLGNPEMVNIIGNTGPTYSISKDEELFCWKIRIESSYDTPRIIICCNSHLVVYDQTASS